MMASLSDAAVFLSTPSARRATRRPASAGRPAEISIHALREEGDQRIRRPNGQAERFLSTPSARRATSEARAEHRKAQEFLSTPSARRATLRQIIFSGISRQFLSTPSARRATATRTTAHRRTANFYPRPPRGGRLLASRVSSMFFTISIHALREEGDVPRRLLFHARVRISIHALREEGD